MGKAMEVLVVDLVDFQPIKVRDKALVVKVVKDRALAVKDLVAKNRMAKDRVLEDKVVKGRVLEDKPLVAKDNHLVLASIKAPHPRRQAVVAKLRTLPVLVPTLLLRHHQQTQTPELALDLQAMKALEVQDLVEEKAANLQV